MVHMFSPWYRMGRVSPRSCVVVMLMASLAVMSAPSTAYAQQYKFNGKGALIAAAIGGGLSLLIMGIQHSRDKDFRVTPMRLTFPDTKSGDHVDQSLIVRNTGTNRIQIQAVAVTASGGAFSIVNPTQTPVELQPGAEAEIAVRFGPMSAQRFADALGIQITKGKQQPVRTSVSLLGRGTP